MLEHMTTVCTHCRNSKAKYGPRGIVCPKCNPEEYRRLFGAQQQPPDPTLKQVEKAYGAGATPNIARLARPVHSAPKRRPPMVTGVKILNWIPETKEVDLRIKFE